MMEAVTFKYVQPVRFKTVTYSVYKNNTTNSYCEHFQDKDKTNVFTARRYASEVLAVICPSVRHKSELYKDG